MGRSFGRAKAYSLARIAVIAGVAGGAAGCSTDTSRFMTADNSASPFHNPFDRSGPATTGTVPVNPAPRLQSAAPASSVARQDLPPPAYPDGPAYSQQGYGTAPAPAPAYPQGRPQTYAAAPAPSGKAAPGWTAAGGTLITVKPGESVQTLSMRYGVPATAIMQANGLPSVAAVQPGQQITIPVYSIRQNVGQARSVVPAAPQLAAAAPPRPPAKGGVYVAQSGDTLTSIGRSYGVGPNTLAQVNQMEPGAPLRIGQKIAIPGSGYKPTAVAAAAPVAVPAAKPVPVKAVAAASEAPVVTQVAYAPQSPPVASPVVPARAAASASAAPADGEGASVADGFRWPVRGRVISRFGSKPSGGTNDGINVAVPEGTSVKAAEDGTVAYVGNELEGYGNLVLIRHSNGYVTAYAHNSELDVKKGDAVRRGQVIAKSGKTGNVATPQVHFEIRKGSSPIDPMQKLETL